MLWLAFLAGFLLCPVLLAVLIACAPEGWESDDGFHHGKPGEGE